MHGPPAPGEATSGRNHDEGDVLIRVSLQLLAVYLVVMLVPMAHWSLASAEWLRFAAHVAAIGLVLSGISNRRPITRTLRDWTPLGLGPFLYIELRWIIAGAGRAHADAQLAGWESHLFASDPSRSLAVRWPWLALSELLHLCYISYYALVYVPPALLWLRGRRRAFGETVLALVVVYAVCFAVYVIFPVDGPRFLHGPSLAPDGPIRSIVVRLLESGSSRGTAFPSSHVAASVVAALSALRFQRRVGAVVAVLATGLAVGAVYGGYHYAVDVLAGAAIGLASWAVARVVCREVLR